MQIRLIKTVDIWLATLFKLIQFRYDSRALCIQLTSNKKFYSNKSSKT